MENLFTEKMELTRDAVEDLLIDLGFDANIAKFFGVFMAGFAEMTAVEIMSVFPLMVECVKAVADYVREGRNVILN